MALSAATAFGAAPLVLGAEDAAGPWGGPDGRGCGNDLVKAAFDAVGIAVELQVLPYARAKALTISGDLVGCFSVSPDPTTESTMVLSDRPLYHVVSTFFQRSEKPFLIPTGSLLPRGAYVGVVRGYEYPPEVEALLARGVNLDPGPSEVVNLQKLAAGRLDAVVVNLDLLKNETFVVREAGVAGKVGSVLAVSSIGAYLGFSLRNPEGRVAKQAFDRGYSIIIANGVYDDIIRRWMRSP